MIRIAILLCLLYPVTLSGQDRPGKMTIGSREIFELCDGDMIEADTLVMSDSSKIVLNHESKQNSIRVKVLIVGNHCTIDGRGRNGEYGKAGVTGRTYTGPCRDGAVGKPGSRGGDGQAGVNLFLYIDKAIVNGGLVVDLAGGNGGDGGNGGEGGGGSPGTVHCNGGDGGPGGNAGDGGNGGQGGSLTLGGTDAGAIHLLLGSQIVVNTTGGHFGYGGFPGSGGSAGLGPSKKDGKAGVNGKSGQRGRPGTSGAIQFEQQ